MPEKPDLSSKFPFNEVFRKAVAGDDEAKQAFFDEYVNVFRAAVRSKLKQGLRSAWDSDDFLQRARIKLLLTEIEKKHFANPQAFIAYIAKIVEREVQQEQRKQTRRGGPMRPLSNDPDSAPLDPCAGPTTALAVEDQWRKTLADLPAVYRPIAAMLRAGCPHVASRFGISTRTVERVASVLDGVLVPV